MTAETPRKSHAQVNIPYRRRKAEKIVRLRKPERPLNGLNSLEIGTGSGVISSYLAKVAGTEGYRCEHYDFEPPDSLDIRTMVSVLRKLSPEHKSKNPMKV